MVSLTSTMAVGRSLQADGAGDLVAASLVRRRTEDQIIIERESVGGKRLGSVDEEIAEVDVVMGTGHRDPPVPLCHQPVDRGLGHAFEIEIEPGLADIGQAAAERNERDLALRQKVEARVDAAWSRTG